jgi:uncharacterized protein (DUF427 family)
MTDLPSWVQPARDKWTNTGARRPAFAIEPGAGQESCWDYPRPPAIVADTRRVEVFAGATLVAATTSAIRVLETSHPPSFYIPAADIVPGTLFTASGSSRCEWKGTAEYVAVAGTADPVGWRYPQPFPEFTAYAGWVSFYPDRVNCSVEGERVRAQIGGFYGGWITNDVVGPFKGEPDTSGW